VDQDKHILLTGGAGYIGSYLVGVLLRRGYLVTVVDELLYGGESLLAYKSDPNFCFIKGDVWESRVIRSSIPKEWAAPYAVIHLAGIEGFPACQAVGRQVAWRYNVETTQHVYEQANELGINRFIYLSSYSNYALPTTSSPATEDSPLNPQSLFAETQVACERYLQEHHDSKCTPLVFRLASLYGISPRPRFDLVVNQFVIDAYRKRELMIYQRGYLRSFLHISDAAQGILLGLRSQRDLIQGQVFNLGTGKGNLTKDEVVDLILKRLPETNIIYKDITFGGDMRDVSVSYHKIEQKLGFQAELSVDDGIKEVLHALNSGLIHDPENHLYRNAQFVVQ
jgi:nucleoside-diphosphate-sugar epimerase